MARPIRSPSVIALVPARMGSKRIPGKNIRPLAGHPLLAYTIAGAREAAIFTRIVVSTDSAEYAEIARYYGAEVPFLRPPALAGSTSPDVEWVRDALANLGPIEDAYALLRPTSPFRAAATIQRAWDQLRDTPNAESVRAVEKVRQHPGKMWLVSDDRRTMRPLLEQDGLAVPLHSQQYASLPEVFVQNSSLEIVWSAAVARSGTHAGRAIAPFLTHGMEGFSLDYEDDWMLAEAYVRDGRAVLPAIDPPPFRLIGAGSS